MQRLPILFFLLLFCLPLYSCEEEQKTEKKDNSEILNISPDTSEEKLSKTSTGTKDIQTEEISEEKHYDHTITYTGSGYIPETITVNIDDKIVFINTSSLPMWTASDPHPVHSDESDFDAKRSYNTGEKFFHSFSRTGTYGFHNHDKSNHRGIITVIDPLNPKKNIDKTKEYQRATRDNLLAILDQNDPKSIYKLIDTIEQDNKLSRDCHDMAHDLGHSAYELFGFSTAMTFSDNESSSHTAVDDICAGGYMHGILEELFLHNPGLKDSPEKVCSGVPSGHIESCFHGVGHGIMFANLRNIEDSLLSCRSLSTNTYTYRCFEGVWMELFWGNTDHAGANSLGWDINDPFSTCQNAKIDEKPTCYLYAHLGYLRTHPRDYAGVVNFCTKKGMETADSEFCIKGIGITMMKHFTSKNLEKTEALVSGIDENLKISYYKGVVGYSLLSGMKKTQLMTFCKSLKKDKKICLDTLSEAK